MYDTILVPIGSQTVPDRALRRASECARQCDATMHLLHVVDTAIEPPDLVESEQESFRAPLRTYGSDAVEQASEHPTSLGIDTKTAVRVGIPYREIVGYVDDHAVDVIFMATRASSTAHTRLGSTTERVILRSPVPVLADPTVDDGSVEYETILLTTDGSDMAERVAAEAMRFASAYDAAVHALYVVDTTTFEYIDVPRSIIGLLQEGGKHALAAIDEMAIEQDVAVRTTIRRGTPEDVIIASADEVDADLISMGISGRGGAGNRFLGSTAARVLRASPVPLLTGR